MLPHSFSPPFLQAASNGGSASFTVARRCTSHAKQLFATAATAVTTPRGHWPARGSLNCFSIFGKKSGGSIYTQPGGGRGAGEATSARRARSQCHIARRDGEGRRGSIVTSPSCTMSLTRLHRVQRRRLARRAARQQLQQHHAERERVRLLRHVPAHRVLWRHIALRTGDLFGGDMGVVVHFNSDAHSPKVGHLRSRQGCGEHKSV